MKKEDLVYEVGKKVLRPLGIIQTVFIIMFASSFFVVIWSTWSFALKIGLTGLVGTIVIGIIYNVFKKMISKMVDEKLKHEESKKSNSSFYQRLKKMSEQKSDLQ